MDVTKKSNCVCVTCKKEVYRKPSHLKKIKNVTCSRECMGAFRKIAYKGTHNPNFGNTGESNPIHKGHRTKHCGYYWVHLPEHPFSLETANGRIREHRYIAEQHHLTPENTIVINGVPYLSPEYDVHHINENRLDNRPENLEVITRGEHSRHHCLESPAERYDNGRFKLKEDYIK